MVVFDSSNFLQSSFKTIDNSSSLNPSENLFLVYQKEKSDEQGDIEATIMDSLLQTSNMEAPDSEHKLGKGRVKRKRASERGFQGTLLQSSTSSAIAFDQDNSSRETCCHIEATEKKVESRPISDTVEVSEEEKEENYGKSISIVESTSESSEDELTILPPPDLVRQLKDLTRSEDESACFEAVAWAMKLSPESGESEIIDAAYAKFLAGTKAL